MVGERIKKIREKNGLTQATIARKLGISRSAVNAWEMGISVPSAQYLVELSKLFKVSTDYLLGLDEKETVDISFLDEEEKRMIYSMLDYFKKYGSAMRNLTRQVESDYAIIKAEADKVADIAVKNILEEILSIKDLL